MPGNPAGAPPLDWCQDDPDEPLPARAEGKESMTARLLVGDVRDRIREIPDGSVDLVCTSPPFLALRKYGDNEAEMGSEANPAAFIDALLELTAEFRRVLAPHGSIAIELGDTYSGSGGAGGDYNDDGLRAGQAKFKQNFVGDQTRALDERKRTFRSQPRDGYSGGGSGWPLSKSLAGIPHAYMLSLDYGWNVLRRNADDSPAGRWRVRNMIVWARPNPPVGALGDKVRPATSYITVGCVSDRRWFDLDAVRTEAQQPFKAGDTSIGAGRNGDPGHYGAHHDGAPPLDWCEDDDPTGHATLILPTAPYPGAHYATWPPTLAKRLIEMLCPLRVCLICGEPSRRIIGEASYVRRDGSVLDENETWESGTQNGQGAHTSKPGGATKTRTAPTRGWTECGCGQGCDPTTWVVKSAPILNDDLTPVLTKKGTPKMKRQRVVANVGKCNDPTHWRRGQVLDPFAGSGTTLAVAHGCGRDATGIELYPDNANLIADRLGMFLEVVQ